jgi:hypothetical protein
MKTSEYAAETYFSNKNTYRAGTMLHKTIEEAEARLAGLGMVNVQDEGEEFWSRPDEIDSREKFRMIFVRF